MKTFLPQNQFLSGCASIPFAKPEAAAACPQPRAAANFSDGVGAKPILAFTPSEAATVSGRAPVAATLSHNAITQAVEIRPALPVSSEPSLPADAPTAPVSAGFLENELAQLIGANELAQLIGAAGKRRRLALPRFVPDEDAIEAAARDPNAPRLREGDPVWADEPPTFLKMVR